MWSAQFSLPSRGISHARNVPRTTRASRDQLAATSLHTIWRMVEAGMGCTLVPELAAAEIRGAAGQVAVKPLVRPIPSRRIGVVYRKGSPATEDARALAEFFRANLPATLSLAT